MPEVIEDEPEINEEEEINLDDMNQLEEEIVEERKIPQIKKEDIFFREGEAEPIPKPKRKKRPPMSEEHKAKLASARVKALETRRRNSQEKKELKELEKKKKEIEKQRLKDFVEGQSNRETKSIETPPRVMKVVEEPKPEPIKESIKETPKPIKTREYITRQELEESNLKAILAYEAIRKQRKQEKQKKEKELNEVDQVRKKIERAMPDTKAYYGRDLREDYFNNCF